jgi:H+-transporting ATPase
LLFFLLTFHFSIILVIVIIETTFFQDKFSVSLSNSSGSIDHNDPQLHAIVYLQVAIISQALIFVTRSHGFCFMERPSFALMGAFVVAQVISSIIAAFGNWGFTDLHSVSGGWIGIVWIWNVIWFIPLDLIKFAMKATVIKYLRRRHEMAQQAELRENSGVPLTRTQSRAASIHESMYSNRVSFLRRAARKVGFRGRISVKPDELRRFSSIQAAQTGKTLARHPSRQAGATAA